MIHTDRIVLVGEKESTINSPIILYRGDRGVEVELTISGHRFMFSNGGNVIKSVNATHGQLVIDTPSGENMISEVSECHDGKIIFIITKEMIDGLEELGFYSFQIRLFDGEELISRVSIPPVYNGIEIREPIATEEVSGQAGIGLANYATVKRSDINENSDIIFDENNTYVKTEWKEGDKISVGKLNKIEESLYIINNNDISRHIEVNAKIDALEADYATKTYVNEEIQKIDVTEQLTDYATKGYVDNAIDEVDVTEQLIDYAKKSELHNHTNKTVLDDITSTKIAEWNNKSTFSGSYNDLTNKPTIPTKTSQLTNDSNFLTEHQDISGKADKTEIPTKTSQLTNDSGYLTSIPSEYVTDNELNAKGYLTEHQDLSNYAKITDLHSHNNKTVLDGITSAKVQSWDNKSTFSGNYNDLTNKPSIPTKTSELTNDSGYITSIPGEYVTETELNNKGYLTQHQDISGKADKSELHNHSNKSVLDGITASKVSSWDNSKIAYGTCSTAAATAEKTIVVEDTNWELEVGSMVAIRFSVTNTASNVTINVNGTGAYPIWYNNAEYTSTSSAYTGYANRTITYMFNGTHWIWISGSYQVSYSNASLGNGYGVCTTAEATLAKACTISSYTLSTGGSVSVKFTNAVPANSTLNIRTRGAKKIFYKGVAITDGIIKAGDTATFVYDGTQYQLISIDSPSDTRNTIGDYQSTDTKLYLAGSTTIDTSDDASYATSFVNPNVYIGTDNALYSENKKVATEAYISSLLDIDYDSLLAFDTNEIIRRLNYVDSDNNLILDDNLPDGTYTLKYEFEDGTYTDITNFIIDNEPIEIDVMEESEKYLNQRWNNSNNGLTTQLGRVAFIFPINVDIDTVCTVTIENNPSNLNTYKDYLTMYFLNDSKTETFDPQEGTNPGYYNSVVWSNNNRSCTFSITVVPGCKYIALNLPLKVGEIEATESDLSGLIITFKKGGAN